MITSAGGLSSKEKTITMLWDVGLALFMAIAFFLASKDRYVALFRTDLRLFLGSLVLAALSVTLFFLYAFATRREIGLLSIYLNEADVPKLGSKPYVVVLLLAVYFGLLVNFSHNIVVFASILVTYNLVDIWGVRVATEKVKLPLRKTMEAGPSPEVQNGARVLHEYFSRPMIERISTLMFFDFVALLLAVLSKYEAGLSQILAPAAYIVVCANIAIGEFVIWRWRKFRDSQLPD